MMFMYKIGVAMLMVLLLNACSTIPKSTAQHYQLGHFSAIPLNDKSYRIRLQNPAHVSQATAEEMTLVKSAQMTLEQGFSHFKVTNAPHEQAPRQTVVYHQPSYPPFYSPNYSRYYAGNPAYHSFWNDPFFNPPSTVVYTEPVDIVYHIEMYKENIPQDAFDAGLILQHLGQKYGISPSGKIISSPAVLQSPTK